MDIQQLIDDVQLNCHISDARHAGNYTLCVYLLKMREFYRWEQQHAYSDQLSKEEIGQWLTRREELWDQVEDDDYRQIHIAEQSFDPFESDVINQALNQTITQSPVDSASKLIYSGGYGVKDKPHFFIAELEDKTEINDYTIYISGKEFARDLTSPPAMSGAPHPPSNRR